tara:strand:- start:514 stop:651 length:138 start_codon:yes stop_codon:yes gene_type:complete
VVLTFRLFQTRQLMPLAIALAKTSAPAKQAGFRESDISVVRAIVS